MAQSRGVFVIVLDSFRADHFDESGSITPVLADLASRGIVFKQAVAPAAWTLPSHVSMFTGLSPTEHRVQSQGEIGRTLRRSREGIERLARDDLYLPSRLSRAGVKTFLGSATGWLSPVSGLAKGFDAVSFVPFPPGRRHSGTRKSDPREDVQSRAGLSRMVPRPVKHLARRTQEMIGEVRTAVPRIRWTASGEDKGAARLIRDIEGWLTKTQGPFFGMVNLIETHDPHIAPKGYGRRDIQALRRSVSGKRFTQRMNRHNWRYGALSPREVQSLKDAYRAEVRYADVCVGRILGALDRTGMTEDCTVIVTADHGEAFGESGLVGHGLPLTESVLRVPLILAGPGLESAVVAEPVSLSSLAASVAAILGVETAGFGSPALLSSAGRGTARAEVEAPGRYFHTSGLRFREVDPTMLNPAAAFYDGNLKLIQGSFWEEALYDLDADPSESKNLMNELDPTPRLERMRAEWKARIG